MIHVDNVSKVFGTVPALDGVSFDVEPGEVVGLLGPNGAGKTTTMRILTGAVPPTRGRVQVAGFDVAEAPLEVKRRVGYLPEVPPVYPEMRVRAYLRFVAEIKGVPRADRAARVDRALGRCALEERADQPIEQLSKGYRQRVGLAQAILNDPELLILDEPTSGLDPRQIIDVRELVHELAGEHTVILSSHILSEIAASCEKLIVMNRGRVVATDTVGALTHGSGGGGTVRLMVRGSRDGLENALRAIGGVSEVSVLEAAADDGWNVRVEGPADDDIRPQLARTLVQAGWELLALSREEPSLEQIFLRLTEGSTAGDGSRDADSRAA